MSYRDVHTDLDYDREAPLCAVHVNCVYILRSTCSRLGPFAWGRIKWGNRTYFTISCFFFTVML